MFPLSVWGSLVFAILAFITHAFPYLVANAWVNSPPSQQRIIINNADNNQIFDLISPSNSSSTPTPTFTDTPSLTNTPIPPTSTSTSTPVPPSPVDAVSPTKMTTSPSTDSRVSLLTNTETPILLKPAIWIIPILTVGVLIVTWLVKVRNQKGKVIKILFLAANPSDTARLRIASEIRAIDSALQQSKYRDVFDIQQHGALHFEDLSKLLLRYKPEIVHFSGHGSSSNEIIFEDESGNSHAVSQQHLSQVFAILTDNIKCVVLNACFSIVQAKAIAEHVDCVIGMPKAIEDIEAIKFSTEFYQALGYGRDIQTAFDLGCVQVATKNLAEQDKPQLIANKNTSKKRFLIS